MSFPYPCTRDCPDRVPGCHDHCKRYIEKKAVLDELKAKDRIDQGITTYICGNIRKTKDSSAKIHKNRSGIRRMPG